MKQQINNPFDYRQFATDIIAKRNADNITLRDLQDKTGVPRSTLFRAESEFEISMYFTGCLCNWLERPVQYYLTPKRKRNGKTKKQPAQA